jgi:hypothetical protein
MGLAIPKLNFTVCRAGSGPANPPGVRGEEKNCECGGQGLSHCPLLLQGAAGLPARGCQAPAVPRCRSTVAALPLQVGGLH